MGAAATAHARPQQQPLLSNLLPHEIAWNDYFARSGFVRTPHVFFTHLIRALSDIERGVVGLILQRTVGAPTSRREPNRPEWIKVTESEFARICDCSVNGVSNALERLEECGAIEAQRVGRTKQYRVRLDAWERIPIGRRTHVPEAPEEPEEEDSAEPTAGEASPRRLGRRRKLRPGAVASVRFEAPTTELQVENETGLPVAIAVTADGGTHRLQIMMADDGEHKANNDMTNPVESISYGDKATSRMVQLPAQPQAETTSEVVVSEEVAAFAAELDTQLAKQVHQRVPMPLASAQYKRLVAADAIPAFWARLKLRASAFKSWGMLPQLVDDVTGAARAAIKPAAPGGLMTPDGAISQATVQAIAGHRLPGQLVPIFAGLLREAANRLKRAGFVDQASQLEALRDCAHTVLVNEGIEAFQDELGRIRRSLDAAARLRRYTDIDSLPTLSLPSWLEGRL